MADMLSPGVFVREIDASLTTPQVSASTAVFAGNFLKGPVGTGLLISNRNMLKEYYGLPNKYNYNDWYMAANYLDYGRTLIISRATNLQGSEYKTDAIVEAVWREAESIPDYNIMTDLKITNADKNKVTLSVEGSSSEVNIGDRILFVVGKEDAAVSQEKRVIYEVAAKTEVELNKTIELTLFEAEGSKIKLDADKLIGMYVAIYISPKQLEPSTESEHWIKLDTNLKHIFSPGEIITLQGEEARYRVIKSELATPLRLEVEINKVKTLVHNYIRVKYIENETTENILAPNGSDHSTLKGKTINKILLARNSTAEIPTEGNPMIPDIEYENTEHLILNGEHFEEMYDQFAFVSSSSKIKFYARTPGSHGNIIKVAIAKSTDFRRDKQVIEGISLDKLYEYVPSETEIAVIIIKGDEIAEKYTVSFDVNAKDFANKSIFIENVINQQSSLVYVKYDGNPGVIKTCLGQNVIHLTNGTSSVPSKADIIEAYNIFDNKEEIDIDIVIGNEAAPQAAINLARSRADCIAFIGCPYEASVGLKAAFAVKENVKFRNDLNVDSDFVMLVGNYKYQYAPEMDKNLWLNLCADAAGLKAETNENLGTWFASAGLNRGKIKNVIKLAYNPVQSQRDQLYQSSINAICTFTGQGPVLWGQKTLQSKPSAFDRVNVRALFNYIERTLARMSKYSLFEQNDVFTRNTLLNTMNGFLMKVQAGRGIQDFLVVCDHTNNPPSVVNQNQLNCDIYIKPQYVAEFIRLSFINAGTNDFSTVIGIGGV